MKALLGALGLGCILIGGFMILGALHTVTSQTLDIMQILDQALYAAVGAIAVLVGLAACIGATEG